MYTQCPTCETYFRVSDADLDRAEGRVRCSQCETVFDARAALRAEFADPALGASPVEVAAAAEPAIGDLFGADVDAGSTSAEPRLEAGEPETATVAANDPPIDASLALAPPALPAAGRPRGRVGPWIAASVLLSLTLGAQLVHAYREPLARDPRFGTLVLDAYRELRMPITEPTDLAKLTVQRTEVTSHPLYRDVLFITATVTNDAEFPQPLPLLRVRLDDRWGEPVGVRLFTPSEYLRHAPEPGARAEPGRVYAIALEVVDPGSEAVGYALAPCLPAADAVVCTGDDSR